MLTYLYLHFMWTNVQIYLFNETQILYTENSMLIDQKFINNYNI